MRHAVIDAVTLFTLFTICFHMLPCLRHRARLFRYALPAFIAYFAFSSFAAPRCFSIRFHVTLPAFSLIVAATLLLSYAAMPKMLFRHFCHDADIFATLPILLMPLLYVRAILRC